MIKFNRIIKSLFLLILLLCSCASFAQKQYEYWFVAPALDPNSNNPIYFYITARDKPANVHINQPLYNGKETNFPIGKALPYESKKVPFLSGKIHLIENSITDASTGVKSNKGIFFSSDNPIDIFYQVDASSSKEIFALRGEVALGLEFYTPFQTRYQNSENHLAYSQFHIVATQDNTEVKITPKAAIVGTPANTTKIITLNRGETFAGRAVDIFQTIRLNGSHIVSNKPIAVTVAEDLVVSVNSKIDLIGDQLIPVEKLGRHYLAVRGNSNKNINDQLIILATKDGTQIKINGNIEANYLNAGQCFEYTLSTATSNVFVEASAPVYVYQVSGVDYELSAALLTSIYSFTQHTCSFLRGDGVHEGNILVHKDHKDGFSVNKGAGGQISALNFTPSNFPDWVFRKLNLTNLGGPKREVYIENTKGVFALNYFNSTHNMALFGHMPQFEPLEFPDTIYKCIGVPLDLDAGHALSYRWWKGEKHESGNSTIGTERIYSIKAGEPGYYSVEIDYDPIKIITTTLVLDDTLNLRTNIPNILDVNNSLNLVASVKRSMDKIFTWDFGSDANPATGTGLKPGTINWSTTGNKTITLKIKDTILNCKEETFTFKLQITTHQQYPNNQTEGIATFKEFPVQLNVLSRNPDPYDFELTQVEFANSSDIAKGSILFTPLGEVNFIPNINHNFEIDEKIQLKASIKNKTVNIHRVKNVNIVVRKTPDIEVRDSCSMHPYLEIEELLEDCSYQWYRELTDFFGETTPRLYLKNAGNYQVQISKRIGNTTYVVMVPNIKIELTTTKLAEGVFYQVNKTN